MVKPIIPLFLFFFLGQPSLTHLLQSVFLCLGNTPWAPSWSWPFAWSITFSFFRFLAPRVLHNPVFHVNRIFHNPTFCVNQIFRSSAFHVNNPTRTSCFLLLVANPVNPARVSRLWVDVSVTPTHLSNPICLLTRAVVLVVLSNPVCLPTQVSILVTPAVPSNLICPPIRVIFLANPDNPVRATRLSSCNTLIFRKF
jgi:hypothetical protein